MFKHVLIEVIKLGREAEDKAYREKAQKLFEKYGIAPTRVFGVMGRKHGQVFVELGEFESLEEANKVSSKLAQDEEWQRLQEERNKAGTVVPGSGENYVLFGE